MSKDRTKALAAERRWRANPKNREVVQLKYMLHRYGLTIEQYKAMVEAQHGVCKICGRPPCDRWKRLHVDHNHVTGKVRGLLCHHCNTALGNFGDSIELLKAAVGYLEGVQSGLFTHQ